MFRLEGGNIDFQLGGPATYFQLLVMNPKGADSLLSSKDNLGAWWGPRMPICAPSSYSRSRGLFAGVSLEASTLHQDHKANQRLYGREIAARKIVLGAEVYMPSASRPLTGRW